MDEKHSERIEKERKEKEYAGSARPEDIEGQGGRDRPAKEEVGGKVGERLRSQEPRTDEG